jgi:hypothetical protein
MPLTIQINELEKAKALAAELEKEIADSLGQELAALPADYGFESLAAFVRAVRAAAGGKIRRGGRVRPKKAKGPGRPKGPKAKKVVKRRKRAVVDDSMRAKVRALIEKGRTGTKIAKALGISLPTVQNIKKALGLVKVRESKATTAPVPTGEPT